MKLKFTLLVFQNGKLDEEFEIEHSFVDEVELAETLASFAAMQCGVRCHKEVSPLYGRPDRLIHLPPARQGYGPETYVVITNIRRDTQESPSALLELLLREKDETISRLQKQIAVMKEQEAAMAALYHGAEPTIEGRRAHARIVYGGKETA